ncbi:DUF292-domain-containing protein [Sistotremastrum niveocremeum HHB9708]|uniref:DUF292-domain-containing protein n=1 Tax=Sistotremastrum niveocremeum HHB9708 TaxID=1314777 RepID=A0A164UTV2_9AGAM|nr:DUF292-domain-containing protein [Sistotremastrum niveocremeum HHB9708]
MWNAARTKAGLRLAVQRLRMLQEKKTSLAKSARRDIATLLERHKLETARVKTENIINEDIYVELLELLELYCELLLARFGLLDMNTREPDPGVKEGVCAVIFAAQRTELKELHVLREMLMQKYGREFSVCAVENREGCVPERVVRRVAVSTPGQELVDGYLKEIAAAYKIGLGELGGGEEEGAASGAGAAAEPGEESGETEPPKDEVDELTRRFEALKKQR